MKQMKLTLTSLELNKVPIPKQPAPDLKKIGENYLKSVKPIVSEEEFGNTKRIVEAFLAEDGLGTKLHSKFLEYYENSENWFGDWWFLRYLTTRDSYVTKANCGMVGQRRNFQSHSEMLSVCSKIICAVWDFNVLLKSGKMNQQTIRSTPLDMQQFGMILGTNRRPNKSQDVLLHTDDSKHIIIMCNNHIFKVKITDESGKCLSERSLAAIIRDIESRSKQNIKAVGILTGTDRDTWAENYSLLKGLGKNEKMLKNVEDSLFILCLDKDFVGKDVPDKDFYSAAVIESMSGFSSSTNTGNRWHDNTLQIIVSPDGFIGGEFEHTASDGVPIATIFDHIINFIDTNKESENQGDANIQDFPKFIEELKFEVNEVLEKSMEKAAVVVDGLSQNIEADYLLFSDFGSEKIKGLKLSPDGFLQIALQLAFYKLHKKIAHSYEAASLRKFKFGRYECIRGTTLDSVEFVKLMTQENWQKDKENLKKVLIRALDTQKKLSIEANEGEAVDRYFYVIQKIAERENIEIPEIFKDPVFHKSAYFHLNSSQVSFESPTCMCFGPKVPDGYGCCYNVRPKDFIICSVVLKSIPETSAERYSIALQDSLREMRILVES